MKRRDALKQLALATSSMALLPGCDFGPEREAVALKNLRIDLEHQDLLARVVETILPSEEQLPGAEVLNLYRFVLVMVDDCQPPEEQQTFVHGLQQIKPFAEGQLKTSFPGKEQAANEEVLRKAIALDEHQLAAMPEYQDLPKFLTMTKGLTIRGFITSQYVMTEHFPYQLIPGSYQGCVSTDGLIVM